LDKIQIFGILNLLNKLIKSPTEVRLTGTLSQKILFRGRFDCFMTLHLLGAIHRSTKQTPWIITSNCGINRFELRGPRNVRVLALNDTRHLTQITGNDAFAAR
jgi:hypothetical protein